MFHPKFVIKDQNGDPVLKITGPFCVCECCSDVDFEITTVDKDQIVSANIFQIQCNIDFDIAGGEDF